MALNEEKQERILRAAFREFGRFGYKKTSVEQIAKSAGIAKGMIFHYFHSKQGLYEYLFKYVYKFVRGYFTRLDKVEELDYIEQYRMITQIKLEAYTANPAVFEFAATLFLQENNPEISNEANAPFKELMRFRAKVLDGLRASDNTERFKEDIDIAKAKNYVSWIIEGYLRQMLGRLEDKPLAEMDIGPYWKEFDEILDDLKKLFYKHG